MMGALLDLTEPLLATRLRSRPWDEKDWQKNRLEMHRVTREPMLEIGDQINDYGQSLLAWP
jgi:hypothetical protein